MRRVAILGSTGSIGRQALDVIASHPDMFEVVALAARRNVELLAEQARTFHVPLLGVGDGVELGPTFVGPTTASNAPAVVRGEKGLIECAARSGADIVVAATDGTAGMRAVFAAVDAGVDVALANKEVVVAAGELLCAAARAKGVQLLPVDSEHSAVHQCLAGEAHDTIRSIVLTASGGPFWHLTLEQMRNVTPEQALQHPNWRMGDKNTLDSATLMNKGLEAIEASRLFDLTADQIDVVIHRQSVAHAFVVFTDGSVKSQLAAPDMRLPIGYALAYPRRLSESAAASDKTRTAIGLGTSLSTLTFEPIDRARFPALGLAYRALRAGDTYPAVLSAANEAAGRAFLQGRITFTQIAELVERALDAHRPQALSLDAVLAADRWAKELVEVQGYTRL